MSLLKSVSESEAQNEVKQVYGGFAQLLGRVPNVVKFHTASTTTYKYLMGVINEFADHPTLDPVLITYLRIIVPFKLKGEYCVKFQSFLIKNRGVTDEEIEIAKRNPANLPIDEKRKALLLFVLDVLDDKHENIEEKLDKVRSHGWTDQEIYELCFIGALQKGMTHLIKAFKVEHDY